MKLNDALRCSHVKRWHIVNTVREQTVAEHSWNVTIIAMNIMGNMPNIVQNDNMRREVMFKAITHDMEEAIDGDIPAPHRNGRNIDEMPLVDQIVKMADILEACWWITENGIGRHATEVKRWNWLKYDAHMKAIEGTQLHYAVEATMAEMNNGRFTLERKEIQEEAGPSV